MSATIHDWIKWAFNPSEAPHRLSSLTHSRQASRDLGVLVTEAEFNKAMSEYTFSHKDGRCELHYFVEDTKSKKDYDFHRFVLVESIIHPLMVPDPRESFNALPESDRTTILDWIESSLRVSSPHRTDLFNSAFSAATGLELTEDQMRGALIVAGHKPDRHGQFHCALTDEAFREYRKSQKANQPIPGLEARCE